ncbi:hypothetical protein ACVGOW_23240 [Pseudonocardia saturnea]
MSAPVTERSRVRTAPRPSRTGAPAIPAQRGAPAAQRAYAKRDERLRRLVGGVRPARSGPSTRRAQFVLFVMVLLGVGLVLTLWLSTAAAADSYRLQDARAAAGTLSEQVEQLRREVAVAASAPELARRAVEMGMVPVQDPARLVVGTDGAVTVVGEPMVAARPAPPVVAVPPAAVVPPVDPAAPVDPNAVDPDAVDPNAVDPALAAGQAPAGAVAADPAAADPAAADAAADPAADAGAPAEDETATDTAATG